jgi:hypothetical protein
VASLVLPAKKMSNISITSNDSPFRIITSPFSVSTHNYTCKEDTVTTGNEMPDLAQIVSFPEFCVFLFMSFLLREWEKEAADDGFPSQRTRVKESQSTLTIGCIGSRERHVSLETEKIKMRIRGKNENEQRP